MILL
ncbi:hypothetical protein LINGRAHAP2_LOCUS13327 [Linum grandiflorum]|jgi:hypothetical protein